MNILCEGFAGLNSTGDLLLAGYIDNGGIAVNPTITTGRFSTSKGMRYTVAGGFYQVMRPLVYSGNSLYIGMALNVNSLTSFGTSTYYFFLRDGSNNIVAGIGTDIAGRMFIQSAANYAITDESIIRPNQPQYWEFGYTAAGTVIARLNNTQQLAINAATGRAASLCFGGTQGLGGGNVQAICSDLYVNDGSGIYANTFAGEQQMIIRPPTADSAPLQWTPSVAGAHYLMVDDNNQNNDTDYIEAASTGLIDMFTSNFPIGTPQSILALSTRVIARKTDTALREIASRIDSAGSIDLGVSRTLGSAYNVYDDPRSVDPATGVPWLVAAASNVKFGVLASV